MSILSDAWRRAHRGRLAETLGAPPVGTRARPALFPWLLCTLLVALAAGLGVFVWLDLHRAPPPVPALAAVPATRPAGEATRPVPERRVAATPRAVSRTGRRQQPTPQAAPRDVRERVGAGEPSPPASSASRAAAPEARGGETSTSEHSAPTHSRSVPPRTTPSAPIALSEAPERVRSAFPSLDVVVHVWNGDPAKRFVVIGARQFRAGDEIASGVRLLKITRRGEVVRFRGYRLVLR